MIKCFCVFFCFLGQIPFQLVNSCDSKVWETYLQPWVHLMRSVEFSNITTLAATLSVISTICSLHHTHTQSLMYTHSQLTLLVSCCMASQCLCSAPCSSPGHTLPAVCVCECIYGVLLTHGGAFWLLSCLFSSLFLLGQQSRLCLLKLKTECYVVWCDVRCCIFLAHWNITQSGYDLSPAVLLYVYITCCTVRVSLRTTFRTTGRSHDPLIV